MHEGASIWRFSAPGQQAPAASSWTAKNRALVAAFEQRLNKPIHVSRYCHLTGAWGAALILAEQPVRKTSFRGIDLFRKEIPLVSEVCDICTNHCKLTLATVEGEKVSYGFLCGRDYDTKRHVRRNPSGFDLMRERKKAFAFEPAGACRDNPIIGIPAALHLYEDIPFWKVFFDALGIRTVTSEDFREGVKEGKHAAGAEFCAPMAALHGHVRYLMDKSDYLFLPFYLEKKSGQRRRQYCYYTQFAPALASAASGEKDRCLTPLVHYLYSSFHTRAELYRMLKSISPGTAGFAAVSSAYNRALEFKHSALRRLREQSKALLLEQEDLYVVLLGRPYTVLSASMNKGIPEIFASLGIKTFFGDMLSYHREEVRSNVRIENTGESMDNLLKIHHIMKCHPDIALFVQTSPAFCCPALVTEAMAREIERKTGVPIVSVTYDGTGGNKNEVIIPFLKYGRIHKMDRDSAPCRGSIDSM